MSACVARTRCVYSQRDSLAASLSNFSVRPYSPLAVAVSQVPCHFANSNWGPGSGSDRHVPAWRKGICKIRRHVYLFMHTFMISLQLPSFVWPSLTITFAMITMIASGRRTATTSTTSINWIVTIALIIKAVAKEINF